MASQTRLRKLGLLSGEPGWPSALIVSVDADGYLESGGISRLVHPSRIGKTMPDGRHCLPQPIEPITPENWTDRHGRRQWRVRDGECVGGPRPLDVHCRQREIDWRWALRFSEDARQRAMEELAAGNAAPLQNMRKVRQEIAVQVDAEIAAGTPLRDKSDIINEVRK